MTEFCPEGMEYVQPYVKKDGTYVHGFCRPSQSASESGDYDYPDDDEEE